MSDSNRIPVLFDLDGVIVDSLEFEHQVTVHIINCLANQRSVEFGEAERLWMQTLANNRTSPLWHSYDYHCKLLGLNDVWIDAHLRARPLLRRMPHIEAALRTAGKIGPRFLVSDATQWVITFKLNAIHLSSHCFSEVFSLDRCCSSKGHDDYWQNVLSSWPFSTRFIYIDNRIDRLLHASKVLKQAAFIWLPEDDHPTSLGIFDITSRLDSDKIFVSKFGELSSAICNARKTLQLRGK